MNIAARVTGEAADAYRPDCEADPLVAGNRYLRLPALFSGLHGGFVRPNGYGTALCHGIFDAAYTRVGDYLVQGAASWFIASQEPLLPILCVRTNRMVSFVRPVGGGQIGANGYGGIGVDHEVCLLRGWPASVLGVSGSGQPEAGLPGDGGVAMWTVLLPASAPVVLHSGDLMRDDLGRDAVVVAAEASELGWRLTVRQATT